MMWWVRHIIISLVSGFFLAFGIHLLINAYKLDNPFTFLMSFFSSNMIILFSAAIFFGFIYRMFRSSKDKTDDE
ncbi:MAG: hypothetical protein GX846_05010 [Deltaproteobacteria bacterium]|nr:hypothetical protein [Deltaproteobacteria bacterium]